MAFSYSLNGVPDLDQKWDALPNNGNMYCVPTSAMNWMYYYAKHGRPGAVKYSEAFALHILFNLNLMGSYMDTDAEDGTSSGDDVDGLIDWMDDFKVPAFVSAGRATDNNNVTYVNIRNKLQSNAHVNVSMGRYKKDGNEFERTSGHAMTLVQLKRTDANVITIGVHDPAQDDGNLNAQSGTRVRTESLTQENRNIEGDVCTVLRWGSGTDPYRFIDAWLAILPIFGVTQLTGSSLTSYTADLKNGSITTKDFPLPFKSDVADLVLHPSSHQATVIADGSGEVWKLDLTEGSWTKMPNVSNARIITYGGRDERLFVVQGREIVSFDDDGKRLDKVDIGEAVDAVSYDQKNNRLVVASSGAKRLFSVTPKLQVTGNVEAPEVPGKGRLSLSVRGRDSTVIITREGAPEAAKVRWHSTGAVASGRFRLLAEGATAAGHVDRKGRLYVSEAGKIATFDTDGNRVPGFALNGLKAGRLLKIARSGHNLDEKRSRRKEWKN